MTSEYTHMYITYMEGTYMLEKGMHIDEDNSCLLREANGI